MTNPEHKWGLNTVLFLCTGNHYRSRFAELYFNALAPGCGLDWRADSRGLAVHPANAGPISRHTVLYLQEKGIALPPVHRWPIQAQEEDFETASLVVAVKEAEHRPLVELHFPTWAARVEYWHVHDLDCAPPEEALPELAARVDTLLDRLGGAGAAAA